MTTVQDWEKKYHKLYREYKNEILKQEGHKEKLFDQIEKLQLVIWRNEITDSELYLVDKIERLEEELKSCHRLLDCKSVDKVKSTA